MNAELEKAWQNTCKVLLGEEIGPIEEYKEYLKKYTDPTSKKHSAISGRDVITSSEKFCDTAKFISHDEIPEYKKITDVLKFDIDEIKDIESILEALNGKFYYVGNIILGNSRDVALSHRCINTSFALECQDIYDSKYAAFSSSVRLVEYFFGGSIGGQSRFCIRTLEVFHLTRCMETLRCFRCSDCYYTASCEDCANCMFSFNLRNRKNCIGNLELPKDKYLQLKTKLVGEIHDTLKREKTVQSIIDVISEPYG